MCGTAEQKSDGSSSWRDHKEEEGLSRDRVGQNMLNPLICRACKGFIAVLRGTNGKCMDNNSAFYDRFSFSFEFGDDRIFMTSCLLQALG